uniref:Uncharacterized protein n=1 Tax=Knipowitschia caucasica TaxID=637954 RepID=A0AAV2JRX2_KNICA
MLMSRCPQKASIQDRSDHFSCWNVLQSRYKRDKGGIRSRSHSDAHRGYGVRGTGQGCPQSPSVFADNACAGWRDAAIGDGTLTSGWS